MGSDVRFLRRREALRRRLTYEGGPASDAEKAELFALRDAWERSLMVTARGGRRLVTNQRIPPPEEELEWEFGPRPVSAQSKPRQRPPMKLPVETCKRLEKLLDRGGLSQEALERQTGFKRWHVRKGQELYELGWPLGVSDPDFPPIPPDDKFVYWPNPKKAASLLGSGRVQRRD